MFSLHIVIYICSFMAIWFGADLIVKSVTSFSKTLRVSSFAVSFIVLGIMTSTPEFGLGITALTTGDPEIFVGNLIGGVLVIYLLIIPVLALLGNGVKLSKEIDRKLLLTTLFVTITPSLSLLDRRVTVTESIFLILAYFFLFLLVQRKNGLLNPNNKRLANIKAYSIRDIIKIMIGLAIVFIASRYIVLQTQYFSDLWGISPLVVSILVLSLGTNLPELSLAAKSILAGHKEVALGDYLGSAAANTLLFGTFSLMNQGEVITSNNFAINLSFILIASVLFFAFTQTKRDISRKEALILLSFYVLYAGYWILTK